MNTITDDILEALDDDMVSHGLVAQCVEQEESGSSATHQAIEATLSALLSSDEVEIGVAKMTAPDYVEFIAWNGTIAERVHRGIEAVEAASDQDKEFAYWLCRRENVDRHE